MRTSNLRNSMIRCKSFKKVALPDDIHREFWFVNHDEGVWPDLEIVDDNRE